VTSAVPVQIAMAIRGNIVALSLGG